MLVLNSRDPEHSQPRIYPEAAFPIQPSIPEDLPQKFFSLFSHPVKLWWTIAKDKLHGHYGTPSCWFSDVLDGAWHLKCSSGKGLYTGASVGLCCNCE